MDRVPEGAVLVLQRQEFVPVWAAYQRIVAGDRTILDKARSYLDRADLERLLKSLDSYRNQSTIGL